MSKRRVVVTGLGIVSPVGNSIPLAWENILAGKSGIGPITNFDVSDFPVRFGGEIRDFDVSAYIPAKDARRMGAFIHYGIAAACQAIEDSGIEITAANAARAGVAIGSGIGGGMAAGACCEGIARQPETSGPATITMLLGQAVTQTPAIFGLLVSFILLFKSYPESNALTDSMALLSAGLCMGFGGIGPGIGNGFTAKEAVSWVSRNVENSALLSRTMLVGMAVAQSTAIYAMVVALVLIFVV